MEDPLATTPAGGESGDLAELRRAWVNEKAAPEILGCDAARAQACLAVSRECNTATSTSWWTVLCGWCSCRRVRTRGTTALRLLVSLCTDSAGTGTLA